VVDGPVFTLAKSFSDTNILSSARFQFCTLSEPRPPCRFACVTKECAISQ
jgi:hypothetical protein